ncbi:MAG: hypothetical protein KatS3mg105_2301 [Gemmatales bacterium]|nr:MAG: hypothetical protein KatS3mg105_2301 [Gemmatales bacterium]
MTSGVSAVGQLDFIEELRLRRWARENHVPPHERMPDWHPVIHDEMRKKDIESAEADEFTTTCAS